jgi:cysteine synthase
MASSASRQTRRCEERCVSRGTKVSFAGVSTGANVTAALRVAERRGPEATVVTLMCDSGIKY